MIIEPSFFRKLCVDVITLCAVPERAVFPSADLLLVEDALIRFLKTKEQVAYLETSVNAARRSVDLALLQYQEGTTDYTRGLGRINHSISKQHGWVAE